LTHTVDTELS